MCLKATIKNLSAGDKHKALRTELEKSIPGGDNNMRERKEEMCVGGCRKEHG